MTLDHLDQSFSNHIIYKNLDTISSKSKISQWYSVVFFSQKMIPAEIQYKIYDQELLVIVKTFKT